MNGWSRYSMFGCSIRDHTLIDVVPITCENKNCLVWKNQPLSLSLPSCSCRSLSLWSRRCKGWTINMNCLLPFYVKYFTFLWEGRSLARWLGRLWNTLWRFSSSLCRWTTEEEGIRKQKNTSYLNNCICICYLNHRTGIVRRVTWIREVFARVHIDVDQALEMLTSNETESHFRSSWCF